MQYLKRSLILFFNLLFLYVSVIAKSKVQQKKNSQLVNTYTFSKSPALSTLNKWLSEYAKEGKSVTPSQASQRELEVVRNINSGRWPSFVYDEYQLFAAGTGNVDSSRLMLQYGIDPIMKEIIADETESIHRACATCDTKLFLSLSKNSPWLINQPLHDGTTPLIAAAYSGCNVIVDILIAEDVDVEVVGEHGLNALATAALRGHASTVTLLVLKGHANLSFKHKFVGTTSLHMAAELGNVDVIKTLCDLGAYPQATTTVGGTPLHSAVNVDAYKSIEPLVTGSCLTPIDVLMNGDTTPLYLAAQHGNLNSVTMLLELGANVSFAMPIFQYQSTYEVVNMEIKDHIQLPNSQPSNGAEALHAAVENGHYDVVKALIEIGHANIESVSIGVTPLHLAVQYNWPKIVKYLIKSGANVDIKSLIDGSTPLYAACGLGMSRVVRYLLDAGASPLAVRSNRHGVNMAGFPLLYASLSGHRDIVQIILSHKNSHNLDVNFATAADGMLTALHAACSNGNVQIVKDLLDHGGNVMRIITNGQSPLHMAVAEGHLDVVLALIDYATRKLSNQQMQQFLEIQTSQEDGSFNALHYAVKRSGKITDASLQIIEYIIMNGGKDFVNSQVSHGSFKGATPLYIAASLNQPKIVQFLLERHANCSITLHSTVGGFTPLLAAIDRGYLTVVQTLLFGTSSPVREDLKNENPASSSVICDPDQGSLGSNSMSQSPILMAVLKGYTEITKLLLDAGAACNVVVQTKDEKGQTLQLNLLQLAQRKRQYDMMQLLSGHKKCEF
jgi:ankyrin repeat protein